jgi:hypothetical protein
MSLAETQRRLWQLVTAPSGVEEALREERVGPEPAASPPLADVIRGDARASATARLDVYASAYFYRIHGVLSQDYPALAAALGEAEFNDVVTSYLLVHPPTHPSLRYAGRFLADFLARHEAATGVRERAPWASDLARFEWAMIDAFDAANSRALRREAVAARAPEEFIELPLELRPGVQLVELEWSVAAIRTALDNAGSTALPPVAGPEAVLVWRPEERVRYRNVTGEETAAIGFLERGGTFADLCTLLASTGDEASTPVRAAGFLERWIADAILVDGAETPES